MHGRGHEPRLEFSKMEDSGGLIRVIPECSVRYKSFVNGNNSPVVESKY